MELEFLPLVCYLVHYVLLDLEPLNNEENEWYVQWKDCRVFSSSSKLLHNWSTGPGPGCPNRTNLQLPCLFLVELIHVASPVWMFVVCQFLDKDWVFWGVFLVWHCLWLPFVDAKEIYLLFCTRSSLDQSEVFPCSFIDRECLALARQVTIGQNQHSSLFIEKKIEIHILYFSVMNTWLRSVRIFNYIINVENESKHRNCTSALFAGLFLKEKWCMVLNPT